MIIFLKKDSLSFLLIIPQRAQNRIILHLHVPSNIGSFPGTGIQMFSLCNSRVFFILEDSKLLVPSAALGMGGSPSFCLEGSSSKARGITVQSALLACWGLFFTSARESFHLHQYFMYILFYSNKSCGLWWSVPLCVVVQQQQSQFPGSASAPWMFLKWALIILFLFPIIPNRKTGFSTLIMCHPLNTTSLRILKRSLFNGCCSCLQLPLVFFVSHCYSPLPWNLIPATLSYLLITLSSQTRQRQEIVQITESTH